MFASNYATEIQNLRRRLDNYRLSRRQCVSTQERLFIDVCIAFLNERLAVLEQQQMLRLSAEHAGAESFHSTPDAADPEDGLSLAG